MVRISKQGERRAVSYKRPKGWTQKTGAKKENLPKGFKAHANALAGTPFQNTMFVPKV